MTKTSQVDEINSVGVWRTVTAPLLSSAKIDEFLKRPFPAEEL